VPSVPLPIAVVAAAVAVTVVGVSFVFSTDARTRRALKKVRVTPISALQPGQRARVRGRIVAAGELLSAPLSERVCVYYLATAEQLRSSGNTNTWREIAREEYSRDFVVEDGSGAVRVRMSVPRVAIVRDVNTRSGTFDDANHREEAFLQRHGLQSTIELLGLNKTIRYVEGALEPGEEVTVLGLVREELVDGRRTLVLDAPDDGPLTLSDDPRAVQAP
jgi:hypothetical protein